MTVGQTPAASSAELDTPVAGGPSRAEWRRPGFAVLAWCAGYLVVGVVLFIGYVHVSRTQGASADGASNALEAWDMLHGNLLLHGWTLTDVSFYTTELPEYMLTEAIRGGLGPDIVNFSAAATYTLLVLLAGLVAKGRATGREGVVRMLIGSGLMLAPQLGNAALVLLQSPDHTGTAVPLLLTFAVLDRAPRRWWVPPVIAVMLAWVVIADKYAITVAVAPLVLVCAIRAYQALVQRRGSLAAEWFDVAVAAAGVVSLGIAAVVVRAIQHAGGFTLMPVITQFASTTALPRNFSLTVEGVFGLFGADIFGMPLGTQAVLALLHLAGAAMAIWAVCRATRRLFGAELMVQVLTVAIMLNLVAYMFSTLPYNAWDTRQIAAVLPFGAVLAGRLLAADFVRARLVPALAAGLACYAVALGFAAGQPAMPAHNQDLADWLVAHHLTTGLSTYEEGNITTLDTGGTVQLRSVSWQPHSVAQRAYQSKAAWYDPRHNYANFVVDTMRDGPASTIPPADIPAVFGPPARTYHVGPYLIYVYNQNLLNELTGPPTHSAGNLGY